MIWVACLLLAAIIWIASQMETEKSDASNHKDPGAVPKGRWEYQEKRLADPRTGKIPENMRMRELAFASGLPKMLNMRDSAAVNFESIGPYNVGGRTRAFAIHRNNPDIFIAGGVSGGMWRSTNAGESWVRTSAPGDHPAVSCVVQDRRDGKSNVWYYGSGETVGNSASKSFSAFYRGSGVWKSVDNGQSWVHLQSTSAFVQKPSDWDVVHAIAVDPVRLDSDIVFAATKRGIQRSNNGGQSWSNVLPANGSAQFSHITATDDGVFYAAISSNVSGRGYYRSEDGLTWNAITPQGLPGNRERTIITYAPSDQNVLYFFIGTPGVGANDANLWKYTYLSGDGSGAGGVWENRTHGLSSVNFDVFGGYCQVLAVKPDNPDVVFLGGTNLFRSTDGFLDTFQITHIGGYSVFGDTNFTYRSGRHYPDQQNIAFRPDNPNVMISTTDGGIHMTPDCLRDSIQWTSLSNGYVTSQFYGIGIDFGTEGSEVVLGGLQDRGTFWTDEADANVDWVSLRGADGAYCEVEDGASRYYISTQYANISRIAVDSEGNTSGWTSVMPMQLGRGAGQGWLFVHPFTLDRVNNEIMYLPNGGNLWRNDRITSTDSATLYGAWDQIATVGGTITAISSSSVDEGVVYLGTSTGNLYRFDNTHTSPNPTPVALNDSISYAGYTSHIAIDPQNSYRAIAVFSNYNCKSLWYTETGGSDWEPIEGNLAGNPDPGVPEFLNHISDGPSMRWAQIVPTDKGYIYFIGTSVGLFSTTKLQGDSTVWVQQGVETIGNVVVDMLKYRESDSWLVVGTHGNGIYAGQVNYIQSQDTSGGEPDGFAFIEGAFKMQLFPNPTNDAIALQFTADSDVDASVIIFDLGGRAVYSQTLRTASGLNKVVIDVSHLAEGQYYLQIKGGAVAETKAFLKTG